MNIVEALHDPNLFGGMFDAPSWKPWRVFLKACFALDMDEAEVATYLHHTGRSALPTKASRYTELVVGRRGGKSRILALIAAYMSTMIDHAPYIVPGETLVVAVIAADRKQASVILGYIIGLLRAVPLLADMIEDELKESVKLTNGVTIEVHTASIGAPRGRTFLLICADECAFWPVGDSANPDIEVINAVRPGLSTIPYSLLLIASSPYAKRGILYQNYARYFGKDDAPVLVWKGSTREMNATLADDLLIYEMYEEDPERAAAEFGAEFRTDIADFLPRRAVEEVIATGVKELPPSSGLTYVGHVDPSGGSADSFTLAIAHLEADGIAVLDLIREVKPPFSPDSVVQEFAAILKIYGLSRVTGDAYAGEWPRERFATHGISYDVSKRNTSAIYAEFLPALNGHRVRLLDLPRLTGQLVGLERRTARAGRDSISHAPGSHDDVANVACGALVQVLEDRRPSLIRSDDLRDGGAAVKYPKTAEVPCAVLWVSPNGYVATVYFSFDSAMSPPYGWRMVILDFSVEAMSGSALRDMSRRLEELRTQVNFRHGGLLMWIPSPLLYNAQISGINAAKIPEDMLADLPGLALSVSGHVGSHYVKVSEYAMEKAKTHAFGGALSFRAGDAIDTDPLRLALLLSVEIACGQENARAA